MQPTVKKALEPCAPKDDPKADLLDLIATAISDSLDIDWTAETSAEHVYQAMEREGIIQRVNAAPQVLEALIHAEAILSYAPNFSTNKGGKGPDTNTRLALGKVRSAIALVDEAQSEAAGK